MAPVVGVAAAGALVPQWGWTWGDFTVALGDGGAKGVFVETNKADFNRLFAMDGFQATEEIRRRGDWRAALSDHRHDR